MSLTLGIPIRDVELKSTTSHHFQARHNQCFYLITHIMKRKIPGFCPTFESHEELVRVTRRRADLM